MNPVLSIFKVFKGARTWGESLYRISMQLLGAILAGVLVGYIFGGDLVAVAQYSDELAAGPKIMVYEFVGTALFFMIIMRVSCLKPNVHTLLTGFGVAIAIIITFPFNGGLTISPL